MQITPFRSFATTAKILRLIPFFALVIWVSASFHDAPPPLPTCPDAVKQEALDTLGEYAPSDTTNFVRLENGHFILDDEVFLVRGINYYPAQYPWRRFLTETDLETVHEELSLLRDAGFNTLRIFLWHEALFNCPGSGAVPNWGTFQRLDGIIRSAGNAGLRLIVTLNDLPDLTDYRLYDSPAHTNAQMAFIVDRYRDEAAILAWDLRNEGDIDYGTHSAIPGQFRREYVLAWLENASTLVQEIGTPHLITAGWLHDAGSTGDYVDFVSFHHWTGAGDLPARLEDIRSKTDKPILLQEFGYSLGRENVTPEIQAEAISDVIDFVEGESLLGWMIWAAFDFPLEASCFPSPCKSEDNAEHYFGIWYSDYVPKPAVELLRGRWE